MKYCDFTFLPSYFEKVVQECVDNWEEGKPTVPEVVAELANQIVADMLSRAPEVRANRLNSPLREECEHLHADWHECVVTGDTHKARLVCIEEIK